MKNSGIAKLTPRSKRVLFSLAKGPMSREQIDQVSGASNGPEVVRQIRRLGFEIPCTRIRQIDRDGQICYPGRYKMTRLDRQRLFELAKGSK